MFMAYAASLRSGDLSRQVGAAIADKSGALLAVGCNISSGTLSAVIELPASFGSA